MIEAKYNALNKNRVLPIYLVWRAEFYKQFVPNLE